MMQTRRAFLAKYSAAWAARVAERRRSGTAPDLRIADVLDGIVAGMADELAALPLDPEPQPIPQSTPATSSEAKITWRSPVFNVGGRFNPFAGTEREAMLASADVCERIGEPAAAAAYRARAAALADSDAPPPASAAASVRPARARPTWSGPNMPPPEPAVFVAGPQLGLF